MPAVSAGRDHEIAVVGAGMLGASAARHLADAGCDVILVGQGEPAERGSSEEELVSQPVYASHYDVARVSRTIDPDPTRAWLGHRSVDQFADVAARTGITAINPVGHLWVDSTAGIDSLVDADRRYSLDCQRRTAAEVSNAMPYLSFSDGSDTIWEPPPAGSVDPRAHVAAETAAAVAAGAVHVETLVGSVAPVGGPVSDGVGGRVEVVTDAGTFTADRVLLATGAFSGHGTSPAAGLDLEYALHTQLLVHLDAEEVERLAGMPSIIGKFVDPADDFYLTPPVSDRRPTADRASRNISPADRFILKLGAPQDDHVRATADELAAWFRTDGDPAFAARLAGILERLLPGLRDVGRWTTSCVTTYTPSGFPFIDWVGDGSRRVACAIGGNGFAAKCAPALGELAAGLLLDREWPTEVDRELFLARYAS